MGTSGENSQLFQGKVEHERQLYRGDALKLSLEGWIGDYSGLQEHCRQGECVQRHGGTQPHGVFGNC